MVDFLLLSSLLGEVVAINVRLTDTGEGINMPSLKFVCSLLFANKFFSLKSGEVINFVTVYSLLTIYWIIIS